MEIQGIGKFETDSLEPVDWTPRFPSRMQLCHDLPANKEKEGEFVIFIGDGLAATTIRVPSNFYDLIPERVWEEYLEPALNQLRNEANFRGQAANGKAETSHP